LHRYIQESCGLDKISHAFFSRVILSILSLSAFCVLCAFLRPIFPHSRFFAAKSRSPIQIQCIAVAADGSPNLGKGISASIALSFGSCDVQQNPLSILQVHSPLAFELSGGLRPPVLAHQRCDFGTQLRRQVRNDEKNPAPRAIHRPAGSFIHSQIYMPARLEQQDTR
jgi:hypothetical protein